MTENGKETTTAGSDRVPQRKGDGVTGPSREVSKRDHDPSGAGNAGRGNEGTGRARQHLPEDRPEVRSRGAFRKTELHGTVRTKEDAKKFRQRILQSLKESGYAEAVSQFETVLRELIDTVIERQNLTEDTLLLQIADLRQQADDLEQRLGETRSTATDNPEVRV